MMHGRGKSSPVIVAGKPANKAQPKSVVAAESAERRMGAKGNADQPATNRTQRRAPVAALGLALASIRQAALLDCQSPRWEPYAGKLQVRVWAGGARQLASLPRQAYGLYRMTVALALRGHSKMPAACPLWRAKATSTRYRELQNRDTSVPPPRPLVAAQRRASAAAGSS